MLALTGTEAKKAFETSGAVAAAYRVPGAV
jgi:hypothetical protein